MPTLKIGDKFTLAHKVKLEVKGVNFEGDIFCVNVAHPEAEYFYSKDEIRDQWREEARSK